MSAFVITNWSLCIITSALLWFALWRWRFLLVKPSIIVIIFFHLQIQWAATIDSADIEAYLPDPWTFALLAQGFPLIGLTISLLIGRRSAKIVWQRILYPDPEVAPWKMQRRAILILAGSIVFFVVLYLQFVPLSDTGLYAIIFDPVGSTIAREESLKLIDNAFIQYGYGFMASAFAPLLSVLLLNRLIMDIKQLRLLGALIIIAAIIGILVAVSLTGARSYAASIVFVMLFAWMLRRGFPFNPIYIAVAMVAILALPVVLTVLREDRALNLVLAWNYLTEAIFNRIFHTPMLTGLYFTHFAQTDGFIGIAAIPRLAASFDITPINAPNHLGLLYIGTSVQSVSMNTSYVFAYYTYFGLGSFVFSLVGLWLLDITLLIYRNLSSLMLIPCVAAASAVSASLVSTEYPVVLLTHGFVVILLTSIFADRFCRLRVRLFPTARSRIRHVAEG